MSTDQEGSYQVGYKKPPPQHRFAKGRSGNPNGRPKQPKTINAFLDKALNTPRTLLDDTLAKNPKKAKIEAVSEKKVFSDGTRTVEIYHVSPVPHSNGLMIAYMPKEKVLFQGDFSLTPGQPANDHVKALAPILAKLNLDYDRYINVHTSADPQTKADFLKALGKTTGN